jgi:RNA polymerase sigma factor (sigma-70 family)
VFDGDTVAPVIFCYGNRSPLDKHRSGFHIDRMVAAFLLAARNDSPDAYDGIRGVLRYDNTPSSPATGNLDAVIVARVKAGDEAAFADLFRTHYMALATFAMSYLGNEDDAKEAASAVFIWLHEHRSDWHAPTGVRAYLFRATRNHVLNQLRGRRREHRRHATLASQLDDSVIPAAPVQADEALLSAEEGQRIHAIVRDALDSLTPKTREVATLRWEQGLGTAEIADVLGMSKPAVLMHVSRALAALRTRLPSLLR